MSPSARRSEISDMIKQLVLRESRLSISIDAVSDHELLNGPLLRINSLGFLGMLVYLEDQLDLTLPDDLFAGKDFNTVSDLVDVVLAVVEEDLPAGAASGDLHE